MNKRRVGKSRDSGFWATFRVVVLTKILGLSLVVVWWLLGSPGLVPFEKAVHWDKPDSGASEETTSPPAVTQASIPRSFAQQSSTTSPIHVAQAALADDAAYLQHLAVERKKLVTRGQQSQLQINRIREQLRQAGVTASSQLGGHSGAAQQAKQLVVWVNQRDWISRQLQKNRRESKRVNGEDQRIKFALSVPGNQPDLDAIQHEQVRRQVQQKTMFDEADPLSKVKPEDIDMIFDKTMDVSSPVSFVDGSGVTVSLVTDTQGEVQDSFEPHELNIRWPRLPCFVNTIGDPQIWYTRDQYGNYKLFDRPGSAYGQMLKPADNPAINRRILQQLVAIAQQHSSDNATLPPIQWVDMATDSLRIPSPNQSHALHIQWPHVPPFMDNSGQPLIYYLPAPFPPGAYDLFDGPGYHPIGDKLKPATDPQRNMQIIQWLQWVAANRKTNSRAQ